jgi:hypothetical protein
MGQRIEDEIHDMLIRQAIINVFAAPPPYDNVLRPKHAQPLRNSGERFSL